MQQIRGELHRCDYLKDIREISQIEDIVELDRRGKKRRSHTLMHSQSTVDELRSVPLNSLSERSIL